MATRDQEHNHKDIHTQRSQPPQRGTKGETPTTKARHGAVSSAHYYSPHYLAAAGTHTHPPTFGLEGMAAKAPLKMRGKRKVRGGAYMGTSCGCGRVDARTTSAAARRRKGHHTQAPRLRCASWYATQHNAGTDSLQAGVSVAWWSRRWSCVACTTPHPHGRQKTPHTRADRPGNKERRIV